MELHFDRGTLRLVSPPSRLDAEACPALCWDPRIGGWRAPAWRHAEVLAALRARGARSPGVPVVDRASAWRDQIPAERARWRHAAPRLRPYQEAAVWAWQQQGRRGIVALPTGSGKTWVALGAVASLAVPTLVLAPTRVLMHQWREALAQVAPGEVGLWGDGQRRRAPLMVATFESAWRHMARWGDRFGLLVLDEVHHFGGPGVTRRALLEMSVAPYRLGLSATPPDDAVEPAPADPRDAPGLPELVGPVVYRAAVGELVGRYLSPFDRVTVHLELSPEERRRYDRDYGAFRAFHAPYRLQWPGASWTEFLRHAQRSDEGRRAVAAWRASRRLLGYTAAKRDMVLRLLARHRGQPVLVFTGDNATAYRIAREALIMPITSDIGRAERDEALARFRRGELRALVSCRVLNEGLDVPDAEVAILVGGTAGVREYVQRIGRVLRPSAGKRAVIYELVTRATPEMRRVRHREERLGTLVGAAR